MDAIVRRYLAREKLALIRQIRLQWPLRNECVITRNSLREAVQTLRWMRAER